MLISKPAVCVVIVAITLFQSGSHAVSVEEDLTLTLPERKALQNFKLNVGWRLKHDYQQTDIYLIRWLRAKSFNLKLAEEMLEKDLQWREEEDIDGISNGDWSDMDRDYPISTGAFDNYGRPVVTFDFDEWDVRKGMISGKQHKFVRHYIRMFEEAARKIRQSQADGKNVTQWVLLINVKHFNLVQQACIRCLPTYASLMTIYENHYPGSVDKIMIVNGIFEIVLNVVRPLMSPTTKKALKVYGTNREQWEPIVFKDIKRNQVSRIFGGTKD